MAEHRDGVRSRWRTRLSLRVCDHVGDDTRVFGDPYVRNPGTMRLGDAVVLYSSPVRLHLVTGRSGTLLVGDGVIVGHGAGVTAYHHIDIGAGTVIGPYALVMDTDFHDVVDRRAAGATGAVRIGRDVRIGAWAIVLRETEIGDGAVIAPGSVVRGKVPPGARVGGEPARPLASRGPAGAAALADEVPGGGWR